MVLKIVPMAGSVLVNGEPQKRSEEILAEVSVTLTLSRLNGSAAAPGVRRVGWGDGSCCCIAALHGVSKCACCYLVVLGAASLAYSQLPLRC